MNKLDLIKLQKDYDAEQRIEEIEWFYNQVGKVKPKIIVEIGIKEGGNLKILSTHLDKDGLAIGIDPRKEIPWKLNDTECKVFHIKHSSHSEEAIKELKSILGGKKIDVLFIDGDHSYNGCIQDFQDYSPFVRKGGIIAIHDIYYLDDVIKAWNEISEGRNKFESEKIHSSIGVGYVIKD